MVDALAGPHAEKLPIFRTLGRMFSLFGVAPLLFLALAFASEVPGLTRLSLIGAQAMQKLRWSTLYDSVVSVLIVAFAYTVVSYVAIKAAEGAHPSFGEALRTGLHRYPAMLGVTLLSMLLIYLGMVLLVVPGLIAACALAVAVSVCAVEPLGPLQSMRRSAALTEGSRWRILGVYAVYFLPIIAIGGGSTFLLQRKGLALAAELTNMGVSLVTVPLGVLLGAALYLELCRLKQNTGVTAVFD